MTSFSDLGLAETLLRALRHEGYTVPTPIQEQAIPQLMLGHDLLGIAQTGTGKTAAFALPILNGFMNDPRPPLPKHVRALVMAPTRELAAQISESFRSYGRYMGLNVVTIVGGVSFGPQVKALARGVDVLVATPGRLLDHMDSGNVRLDHTSVVVLDEADHMLDLGFVVPIRKIMSKLPKKRHSLFFSATMPKEIATLAGEFLTNPVQVAVTPVAATADRVAQEIIMVDAGAKGSVLVELLRNDAFSRTIVFTRTKRGADRVSKSLDQAGIASAAIHGNKSQGQRQAALDGFKNGRTRVLVATDIAARGIDVSGVSHVVNFEMPDVPESYVHRIGRTARAGAEGCAVSLVENAERHLLRAIEKLTRQSIPVVERRSAAALAQAAAGGADAKPPARGGRGGQRPQGQGQRPQGQGQRPQGQGQRPQQGARPDGQRSGEQRQARPD
ncbi:MAG: ATP-dependent helicase, partial [Hyphomicrobiales bacterium]|nr:ATP-dependent helicase [Hyphomicrobiales bacterium]